MFQLQQDGLYIFRKKIFNFNPPKFGGFFFAYFKNLTTIFNSYIIITTKQFFNKGEKMNTNIRDSVSVNVKLGATYLPEYKTNLSAAADIYSLDEKTVQPKTTEVFSTGLFIRPEPGYCIRVLSRSGLAFNHGVFVLNADGLIDEDYSDEIKIVLANFSDEPYLVREGDRIAQLKVEKYYQMEFTMVNELPIVVSNRTGGLGSTGR